MCVTHVAVRQLTVIGSPSIRWVIRADGKCLYTGAEPLCHNILSDIFIVCVLFSRQGLMEPKRASNSLCSENWPGNPVPFSSTSPHEIRGWATTQRVL